MGSPTSPAVYDVAGLGEFLATRMLGRRARVTVEGLLAHGPVVFNFSGVEAVTGGFADELIGRLAAAGATISLQGMNADVRETVEWVLVRRGLSPAALWGERNG